MPHFCYAVAASYLGREEVEITKIVGEEPFAVLLPDELMVGKHWFLKQMVEAYNQIGGNIIGALEVPNSETDKYGIVSLGVIDGRLTEVTALVEKPAKGMSPSNSVIPGLYILQPEIMHILENQQKGAGSAIQLTDAMAPLIADRQPAIPRVYIRWPAVRLR